MNRIKKLILTLSSSMLISGAAFALDGISIGIIGSTATFDTAGSEFEGGSAGDKETNSTTHSKSVDYPSVFVDYTHVFNQVGLTIGVEVVPGDAEIGAKSRTDTTTDANESDQSDGTYTAKAEVSDYQTIYIEPTMMVKENVGIYVKGGVSEVTVTSLESIAVGTDSSAYGNETVYGILTGVGVKGTTESGIGFKLEHVKTDYEGVELNSSTGNKNRITADVDQTATRIAIFYNF